MQIVPEDFFPLDIINNNFILSSIQVKLFVVHCFAGGPNTTADLLKRRAKKKQSLHKNIA